MSWMKRLEMGLIKYFIDKAVFALTHEREPKCYIFIVLISKLITTHRNTYANKQKMHNPKGKKKRRDLQMCKET